MFKKIFCFAILPILSFSLAFAQQGSSNDQASSYVITAEKQQQLTPQEALQKLIKGNERYLTQTMREIEHTDILAQIKKGQHPFAFILTCIDSRTVPEILFDQTKGNLFVGRVAGNIIDKNMLGSMEFATKFMGTKLIVVMGHTYCGAVQGACKNVQAGNLTGLLQKIQPAVTIVKKEEGGSFSCKNSKTINAIAKQNVLDQIKDILKGSTIIAKLVKEKMVMIVGAMQNIATGKVSFFNDNGKTIS